MNLTDFEALSFDCYGTLIDWETGLKAGLRRLSGEVPVERLLETYGECEARLERESPSLPYPEVIRRSVLATATEHGIRVPEEMATAIGHSVPAWPAFPDSAEALGRLKQRFTLIILSNVDRASFAASNARLGVAFDAVLTAEDIGSYKPDPRNFDALLARAQEMGTQRGKLLHVAQSLFHDHVPAAGAGLPRVWINRRSGQPGAGATPIPPDVPTPDWTFPSMAEFADAVDAAYAGKTGEP